MYIRISKNMVKLVNYEKHKKKQQNIFRNFNRITDCFYPIFNFFMWLQWWRKTNRFCINYLHNFDKTTHTLDLSKTNITHIPDGSFAKSFLETSVKEAKLANYNDLFLNGEVNIRKIIFPESIEYIGRAAFEALQIEELDFTNCKNLSLIDSNAFWKIKLKH